MNEEDLKIYNRLQQIIKSGLTESSAKAFLAQLSPHDYSRLITLFKNHDFPGISEATKEKLLAVLERLQTRGQ
jgi:hypothetical protein